MKPPATALLALSLLAASPDLRAEPPASQTLKTTSGDTLILRRVDQSELTAPSVKSRLTDLRSRLFTKTASVEDETARAGSPARARAHRRKRAVPAEQLESPEPAATEAPKETPVLSQWLGRLRLLDDETPAVEPVQDQPRVIPQDPVAAPAVAPAQSAPEAAEPEERKIGAWLNRLSLPKLSAPDLAPAPRAAAQPEPSRSTGVVIEVAPVEDSPARSTRMIVEVGPPEETPPPAEDEPGLIRQLSGGNLRLLDRLGGD